MTHSVTVIGAGSVGLGVAASLALAGQKITLLARSSSVAALKKSGRFRYLLYKDVNRHMTLRPAQIASRSQTSLRTAAE